MKQFGIYLTAFLVFILIFSAGCKKKEENPPCENKGRICLTNKLDTTATVEIFQQHNQFSLLKDQMECLSLEGDQPYQFIITCQEYRLDTTIMILVCDDKQMILKEN